MRIASVHYRFLPTLPEQIFKINCTDMYLFSCKGQYLGIISGSTVRLKYGSVKTLL